MPREGIQLDNYNTLTEWGLYVVTRTDSGPQPKLYTVDVPGGNGAIDVTEAVLGSIAYSNRQIECFLRGTGPEEAWANKYSEILASIQGRKMQITFPDDIGYYYVGRVSVTDWTHNGERASLTLAMDCEPFKYEINAYGANWLWDPFDFLYGVIYDDTKTISGTTTVTVETLKMPVTPSFRATKAMTLTCEGNVYTIPADTDITFYELVLTEGSHALTFKCSGTGTVKIMFTNGVL